VESVKRRVLCEFIKATDVRDESTFKLKISCTNENNETIIIEVNPKELSVAK
jgi:hypothetical protein